MKNALLFISLLASSTIDAQQSTFQIELSSESCDVLLKQEHVYVEEVDSAAGVRIITANGIPNHATGTFPNSGNPNRIQERNTTYTIPLHPEFQEVKISAMGKSVGVLFSGIELDPYTAEFFMGTNGANREWNITTLTSTVDLGLDCNNAHVQPDGKYHYHGTPNAFLDELGNVGEEMVLLGYAADGFPIYYKYAYNSEGELVEYQSSYQLKEGDRPGDGKSAPDGPYDGTYFQDYEYIEALSELDQCNGRWGRTPNSDNEYYYLITDNFPSSPICFSAQPSQDFVHQAPGGGDQAGPRPGERPDPVQIMQHMDLDHDDRISRSEARGPLRDHFDQMDKNGDGFVDLSELKNMRPPQGRPR